MKARLQAYLDRLDGMSLRERVMIFLMLAGVLVALSMTFVLDPLVAKQKQLSQKFAQSQAQTEAMEAQMRVLTEASKIDPDASNKARLALLEEQRKSAVTRTPGSKQQTEAGWDQNFTRDFLTRRQTQHARNQNGRQ